MNIAVTKSYLPMIGEEESGLNDDRGYCVSQLLQASSIVCKCGLSVLKSSSSELTTNNSITENLLCSVAVDCVCEPQFGKWKLPTIYKDAELETSLIRLGIPGGGDHGSFCGSQNGWAAQMTG